MYLKKTPHIRLDSQFSMHNPQCKANKIQQEIHKNVPFNRDVKSEVFLRELAGQKVIKQLTTCERAKQQIIVVVIIGRMWKSQQK